jgi:hypothetical protein
VPPTGFRWDKLFQVQVAQLGATGKFQVPISKQNIEHPTSNAEHPSGEGVAGCWGFLGVNPSGANVYGGFVKV